MENKELLIEQNEVVVSDPPKRRVYTVTETVFAWISLLAGYVFCCATPVTENPFGALLFVLCLYGVTAFFLRRCGVLLKGLPLYAALSAAALSLSLVLCANPTIHKAVYTYALAVYMYVVYAAAGNSLKNGFSNLVLADFFRALLILPFASFGAVFRALFANGGKKGGKVLLRVLLGVAIALVPTVVVCVLLSYDNDFVQLLDRLFDWDVDIFTHIGNLILGIPIGMYLFGAYVSAADHRCADVITCDDCERGLKKIKVLPTVTALAALLPILAVYVLFFVSQWKYYVACFVGELPAQTVYSEYARDGFFQLCTVSVINFVMLAAVSLFTARKGERPSGIQRVLTVSLSVETLILISTAVAKMVMYIDCYGLTPKRVYASWLMVVLAVIFVLIIVQQCVHKLKLIPAGITACVILFAVLAFSNVDAFIARYNVSRYLEGSLSEIDVVAMEELGDSAVPAMVRLMKNLDEQEERDIVDFDYEVYYDIDLDSGVFGLYEKVACYLYSSAERLESDVFSATIPRLRARTALQEIGIRE